MINPFLMSIYLLDLIQALEWGTFLRVLLRATLINGAVFLLFAWDGEAIFTDLLDGALYRCHQSLRGCDLK